MRIIIAIDGPAGSGKTTTAKLVAEELDYIYIDTGAMYRAVTLAWINSGKEMTEKNLTQIVDNIEIKLEPSASGQKTILNGEDVSDEIRTSEVTNYVSPVSAMSYVREKMVAQQRDYGRKGGAVMDGRDIGTVVFPDAQLKIFLIASIEARAQRRAKEMKQKGIDVSINEIREQIEQRDKYDSSRSNSPLKKAEDAIEIDTSNLTINEQKNKILELAKNIISEE